MKRMILFVVCLALLTTLSGCAMLRERLDNVFSQREPLQEQQTDAAMQSIAKPEPESTTEPAAAPAIEPTGEPVPENFAPTGIQIPDREDAIVLLYDETGTAYDDEHYSYRVPLLNCQTPDALRINASITEAYEPLVQEMLALAAEGMSTYCYRIDYETVWCGDILGLIVCCEYDGGGVYYTVYNFDRVTGCEVTNAELLACTGFDEETFVSLAMVRCVEVFDKKYQNIPEDMKNDDFTVRQRVAYATEEYIHPDMRMYLREDGALMLISPIGSIAGADAYEEIYPLVP